MNCNGHFIVELDALLYWLTGGLQSLPLEEYERDNKQNIVIMLIAIVIYSFKFLSNDDYQEAQEAVDQWIKKYGVRYFSELTNMAVLTEEVGELARIMARRYGDQSWKVTDPRR